MTLMTPPNLILMIVLTATSTLAQNSDVGILLGPSQTKFYFGSGNPGESYTLYSVTLQVNYAHQLEETSKGRLYLELPVSTGGAIFFTPGLRYHLNLTPRVVVYAAAGAGVANRQNTFRSVVDATGGKAWRTEWRTSPAYNLGAGLDLRLTRLLSLRGELRRFRATSVPPNLGYGRTYPMAQFGFALHF